MRVRSLQRRGTHPTQHISAGGWCHIIHHPIYDLLYANIQNPENISTGGQEHVFICEECFWGTWENYPRPFVTVIAAHLLRIALNLSLPPPEAP